ncbi:MAG TPA: DNA-3-methyladenine glycosylase 2 family protein [Actinomycetes bacterium]|nr:DNA-3-methyladenine glycosylase 2 family protein [Actinomycetes bacterium]
MGAATLEGLSRTWSPGRPVDLAATLGPLRRGSGDPTFRVASDGLWRAVRTPDGPGTQRLAVLADAVSATAWGPGARWLLDTLPRLLGADDDIADWEARVRADDAHPLIRRTWRSRPGWRVPRSGRVWESLVPAILEQKVTGLEARHAFRRLVLRFGTPAPGPAGVLPAALTVPPDPRTWGLIPSWEWHRARVGPERSRTVVAAAARAAALERTLALPHVEAERALRSLPGVGVWTAAEVRQRAYGDPDAVSLGDAHLAQQVVYALTGEMDGDDARLLELLQPYAGHRYRVVRMVELSGVSRPRRGPRYAPLDHRGR